MIKEFIAFDQSNTMTSNRTEDGNGYLRIDNCVLTRACVSQYLGREIVDYEKHGLDANKIYGVLRDPDELSKGYKTFEGNPLLNKHVVISSQSLKKDYQVGAVGNNLTLDDDKNVKGTIFIHDHNAIQDIKNPNRKKPMGISCGYAYDSVLENGNFNGKDYTVKMINIRGNHVALVEDPRVENAFVADSATLINKKEGNVMNKLLLKILGRAMAKDADVSKEDVAQAILAVANSGDLSEEEKLEQVTSLLSKVDDDSDDDVAEDDSMPENAIEKTAEEKTATESLTKEEIVAIVKDIISDVLQSAAKESSEEEKAMDQALKSYEMILGKANLAAFDGKSEKVYEAILRSKNIAYDGKSAVEKKAMSDAVIAMSGFNKQATDSGKNVEAANSVLNSNPRLNMFRKA